MGDDSQAFIAAFAGLSKSMLTSITAALSDNSLSEASKGELVKAQHIAGWVVLFFGASQGIGRIDDGRHATLTDTEMIGIMYKSLPHDTPGRPLQTSAVKEPCEDALSPMASAD